MFSLSLQTTFLSTFQILLLGGCGYILTRKGFIDESGLALFSRLVINLFLPSFILYNLLQNFSFELFPNWWIFPLISFGVTLVGFLTGQAVLFLARGIKFKKEFAALTSFQNSGYIPLILVATLFSPEQAKVMYVYIFLFLIGFDLVLWSAGVWVLTRHKIEKFEMKDLIHSPVVAILISLFLIFIGLQKFVPVFIMKPLKMFGDCTLPLSMLIVGGNLARLKLSEVKIWEIALVVGTKLVLIPLLALLILSFIKFDFLVGFLIILEAAVPSAVSLAVIARQYKIEETFINQGLVFSHIFGVVTIPVFLVLYSHLRGGF